MSDNKVSIEVSKDGLYVVKNLNTLVNSKGEELGT